MCTPSHNGEQLFPAVLRCSLNPALRQFVNSPQLHLTPDPEIN